WTSGTSGLGGTSAVIQDDGNLVIQKSDGTPVWSINTGVIIDPPSTLYAGHKLYPGQQLFSPGLNYRLILQTDGNLVIYNRHNLATWATGTNGRYTADLAMQGDGNLVLYDDWGNAIWTANITGM